MESCIDEYDEVSEQMSQLSDTDSVLENTEDCDGSETASVMEESPESREISTRSVRKVYLKCYYDQKITFIFSSDFETMFVKHSPSEIICVNFEKKTVNLNCNFPV